MKRNQFSLFALVIALAACAAMISACATEPLDAEMMSPLPYQSQGEPSAVNGKFRGVWSVNDTPTDTMVVGCAFDPSVGGMLVAFHDFPFKSICQRLFPGQTIVKVTTETPDGSSLSNAESLYLKTLVDYGDNDCLEMHVSQLLKNVGYSASMLYFELPAVVGAAYRYFPVIMTPDDGKDFAMVLDIIPDRSTFTIDVNGEKISCTLTVSKVEVISQSGEKTDIPMNPYMKLGFTSIKKVENFRSGE